MPLPTDSLPAIFIDVDSLFIEDKATQNKIFNPWLLELFRKNVSDKPIKIFLFASNTRKIEQDKMETFFLILNDKLCPTSEIAHSLRVNIESDDEEVEPPVQFDFCSSPPDFSNIANSCLVISSDETILKNAEKNGKTVIEIQNNILLPGILNPADCIETKSFVEKLKKNLDAKKELLISLDIDNTTLLSVINGEYTINPFILIWLKDLISDIDEYNKNCLNPENGIILNIGFTTARLTDEQTLVYNFYVNSEKGSMNQKLAEMCLENYVPKTNDNSLENNNLPELYQEAEGRNCSTQMVEEKLLMELNRLFPEKKFSISPENKRFLGVVKKNKDNSWEHVPGEPKASLLAQHLENNPLCYVIHLDDDACQLTCCEKLAEINSRFRSISVFPNKCIDNHHQSISSIGENLQTWVQQIKPAQSEIPKPSNFGNSRPSIFCDLDALDIPNNANNSQQLTPL